MLLYDYSQFRVTCHSETSASNGFKPVFHPTRSKGLTTYGLQVPKVSKINPFRSVVSRFVLQTILGQVHSQNNPQMTLNTKRSKVHVTYKQLHVVTCGLQLAISKYCHTFNVSLATLLNVNQNLNWKFQNVKEYIPFERTVTGYILNKAWLEENSNFRSSILKSHVNEKKI